MRRRRGAGRLGGMKHRPLALVAAAVLLCAANDAGLEDAARTSQFAPTGAFSAFLSGRSAALGADLDVAAEQFQRALEHDQGNPEIAQQAFLAALMADRPEAAHLAERLPANQVAQLLLADREAAAGHWDAAEARYAALPRQGVSDVMRPLLVAWAKQGGGHTEAALASLQPLVDGPRYRGVFALNAALIADQGGKPAEAAALYRTAQAEYGTPNLRLGQILASWQARTLRLPEAQRTVREMVALNGDLVMASPALEAAVSAPAVPRAADGIAEVYLAMAATVRQQNATEMAQVLLQLALRLRPDFTPARLLMADIQDTGKRTAAALLTLEPVAADDPLSAVVRLRRAALLDAAGRHPESVALLEALAREYPDRPEPLTQLAAGLRRRSQFGEAAADLDAVRHLAAEVVHQHGQVRVRVGRVEHLGRAHRRAGVADQGVRHGAAAVVRAEVGCGEVRAGAGEAAGALAPGRVAADAGGVAHHALHLGAGAVPGLHRQERHLGQGQAHLVGVVGGDAGRAELLQQQRLAIGQLVEAAGEVEDRLARADPGALGAHHVEVEARAARGGDLAQPIQHQPRRRDHRAAQEHGVGDAAVAESADHLAGVIEVGVGALGDVGGQVGGRAGVHCAATAGADARAGNRRALSSSATRKASSNDCSALSRGSQNVS